LRPLKLYNTAYSLIDAANMTSQPAAVPMVDLRQQYHDLKSEIDNSLAEVLEQTQFIQGSNVRAFEKECAEYLGVKHAIGCANGTDALHLAMLALQLGPGDEVITTPFTFIATAEAIAYVGATPVFVDIQPNTYNLATELIEAAITERTKAIVPVHLFGLPCNMSPITQMAREKQLHIIEDCAQSFGATVNGQQTGSVGDIGCFSFFPSKNLGAFGDGGLVCTNNDAWAADLRMYGAHGSKERYIHSVVGYNSRLDEMQAAILRQKLPHIDRFNAERRRVAARYCEQLQDLPLQLPVLQNPSEQDESVPVFHQFTLLSDQRDVIQQALQAENIASAIYYPIPLHKQVAIQHEMTSTPVCPVSENYSERCVSLPIYPELNNDTVDRIAAVVRNAIK